MRSALDERDGARRYPKCFCKNNACGVICLSTLSWCTHGNAVATLLKDYRIFGAIGSDGRVDVHLGRLIPVTIAPDDLSTDVSCMVNGRSPILMTYTRGYQLTHIVCHSTSTSTVSNTNSILSTRSSTKRSFAGYHIGQRQSVTRCSFVRRDRFAANLCSTVSSPTSDSSN